MLLGNDAANILAEKVSGSIDDFVIAMNEKAVSLGCSNTHFVNANGLDKDDHYSSAYDLAIMYRYAYNNFEAFRRISKVLSFTLPNTNIYNKDPRILQNTNSLIVDKTNKDGFNYYYSKCDGGKTGYTSGAKNCLVASASSGDITIISCILGGEQNVDNSSQRYKDTIALFDYGFQRLVKKQLVPSRRLNKYLSCSW